MLFADEGCTFGDTAAGALTFLEKPERKGTHGHDPALPDLHATFIAWGVGIQSGAQLGEIQNTEVAPTIAAILGIAMPDTDGKPLAAALKK
jgi:predicted AlkP superfamily pyrophosphatase or phosphodiesterase